MKTIMALGFGEEISVWYIIVQKIPIVRLFHLSRCVLSLCKLPFSWHGVWEIKPCSLFLRDVFQAFLLGLHKKTGIRPVPAIIGLCWLGNTFCSSAQHMITCRLNNKVSQITRLCFISDLDTVPWVFSQTWRSSCSSCIHASMDCVWHSKMLQGL